jgi:hypothetical protein
MNCKRSRRWGGEEEEVGVGWGGEIMESKGKE